MSIDKLFFISFSFFFGIFIILQIYIGYKIRKISQQTGRGSSKAAESRLSSKETFRFGLFHVLFYLYIIVWSMYNIWVGKFSLFLGVAIILGDLMLIRKPIKLVRENRPVYAEFSLDLPQLPKLKNGVTSEVITEILSEESVGNIIKNDLKKTLQIGHKEQWRLGLLTPDKDTYDLSYNLLSRKERARKFSDPTSKINLADQIPIKRAAILNATTYFRVQANRILVIHGTVKPMIQQYPGGAIN